MAEKTLGNEILLRMKRMVTVKDDYEDLFEDIGRLVNPRRELIKNSQRFDQKGKRKGKDVFDGTPQSALNTWADGMQGVMVSQSLRWFVSEMDDIRMNSVDEVRSFLQDYDEAMYAEFRRSNFYSVLPEWFRDAGSIGTATLYTEEDIGNFSQVHIPIHPREVFIEENRYGDVDVIFRKFFLTARQAVQKFGTGVLNPEIIKDAEERPDKRHEFIHAVFPNNERQFNKITSTNKKFKSVYVQVKGRPIEDTKDGLVVQESGFDINPYAVWRFRKNSDEIYGYSPAADAIVEIYGLNQLGKTMLKAAHLSVSPAYNVPEHMRGNVRIQPDGYNYYENKEVITPVQTKIDFPIGIDREERLRDLVEDKYRVQFFLTLQRAEREMTATEVMERQSEKAVLMGPQVDKLIRDGLSKVFDIVSFIADRAGRLPEPPPILQETGGRINIRFVGPLAQAQRRIFRMQPIKNGLNELAQASILFPHIIDIVDEQVLAEEILDNSDFPQKAMRSSAKVEAIREERERKLAQQEMMQNLQAGAEGYNKVTKKPEEGSPGAALAQTVGAA